MPIPLPEELSQAKELIDQAKFGEALEITENFEKTNQLSPEDKLSTLLTKGRIYAYTRETEKELEAYSNAYEISQELGLVAESIEALTGKAYIVFIGDLDKGNSYVLEAERILNSLADNSSTRSLRRNLLLVKSWILFYKFNFMEAAKLAQECLELSKEQKNNLNIATALQALGYISAFHESRGYASAFQSSGNDNQVKALDYAMRSLEYNQDLNHTVAIADNYALIARIYWFKGDYDQAMYYCKQSLSIKEISKGGKLSTTVLLADIYFYKSEIQRSLKYRRKAIELAKEINSIGQLTGDYFFMGYTYQMIGETDQAVEYLERCLNLSEKWGLHFQMAQSLSVLTGIYINENSREIAKRYFSRLSELYNQTTEKDNISFYYLSVKALMMKTSIRLRDRMEAQGLYKELIEIASGDGLMGSIGSLCDLLLEELSMNNDPAILDEIMPLITKSLEIAERSRNYLWLANTKLLQGKLALIQVNFEEAKQFLTQAQRIAELHGLYYLARDISEEHDKIPYEKYR